MRSVECEAIVFGGGFSGTLLATLLARQGTDVVVLERQQHPRFTIGESSTPLANQTLRDLASTYDLRELEAISRFGTWRETYPDVTCGLKRGFAYFRHEPDRPFHSPDRRNELLVVGRANDRGLAACDTGTRKRGLDRRGTRVWEAALRAHARLGLRRHRPAVFERLLARSIPTCAISLGGNRCFRRQA